jgi:diguanylate cyclase (GGDEF)-like protein
MLPLEGNDIRIHARRLELALNNMSQGLIMFDSSATVIVCNERYIRMYGLSADVVRPGCTLRELIRHRKKMGSLSDDPERYCADIVSRIAARQTTSVLINTVDGRAIHAVERALTDGSWVVTHEDVTERQLAEAQVVHLAHHDSLTGLPNRFALRKRLEEALKSARCGEQLAVFYLDLDNFKTINDALGHPVGDELLSAAAGRLRSCVREVDTVARLGGDEFAIVQVNIGQPSGAMELAERIREVLTVPYDLSDHQAVVDTSIGIAISPSDGTDSDQLLKNADLALYEAKAAGRGTHQFFKAAMDMRIRARRNLEMDLRRALVHGELELYYQPVIDLGTNRIRSCEALLRWCHPERGFIPPAEFIPIAEETGLIMRLGQWVLRTACAAASFWPDEVKIAVNVSPVQFKCQDLVQQVINALAATQLAATRLEIEITESSFMQNVEATIGTLHRLRELGVRIVMDDFGTGHSSLSYLRTFPFDKLKIDRSFIQGLSDGGDSLAIVRAVTSLASCLQMTTTAEGIESEQQRQAAKASGCTEMQGYLFSRPIAAAEIAKLLCSSAQRQSQVRRVL